MNHVTIRTANFIRTLQYYLSADFAPLESWLNTETYEQAVNLYCPEVYQDVIIYDRHFRGVLYNVSDDTLCSGEKAIGLYQARYIIEKIPREEIKKALKGIPVSSDKPNDVTDDWVKEIDKKAPAVYQKFSELLDEEDFLNKFTKLDVVRVTAPMLDDFDALFRYPARLEFTPKAHETIHEMIKNNKVTSRVIDYYLSFGETYEDAVSEFDLIGDIVLHSQDDHLIWTAGDILNIIWKLVPSSDEYLNRRFEKLIYNIYWPHINSLWPIVNYPKYEFKEERDSKIFDDALGWITSLNTITDINPDFGEYLDFLADFPEDDQLNTGIPKQIRTLVFKRKYHDKSPRRFLHLAFDKLPEEEALAFLYHPESKDEAKTTMDIILNGEIIPDKLPYLAEQLLITGNPDGIGPYIINRFAGNLEKYESFIETIYPDEVKNRFVAMSLFTAACDAISSEDEFKSLEKLARAIMSLPCSKKSAEENAKTIATGLQKAKNTLLDISVARKKLIELIAY